MSACRIAGCDGVLHGEGICFVDLVALPLGAGYISFETAVGEPPRLSVSVWTESQAETPTEVRELADRFRAFAAALDQGAAMLSSPSLSTVPRAAAREQVSR